MELPILEEHCSKCNEPLFSGYGRYRIEFNPVKSLCVDCGEETIRFKQSLVNQGLVGNGNPTESKPVVSKLPCPTI